MPLADESFDYVIVGAGSAGCVLADRLTADGRSRVLLLEYGGSDGSVFIQMPSALSIPMNMEKYNWFYHTEPEPHLNGRRMHTPRGKVKTSTDGARRGPRVGRTATYCRIFGERKPAKKEATSIEGTTVSCKPATAR